MKHLFYFLLFIIDISLPAQYFSNVYYTTAPVDSVTDLQIYDGLKTIYNYGSSSSDWYQVGLGTFRNKLALKHIVPPDQNQDLWTNKVTFHRTSDTGIINQNFMYRFFETDRNDSLLDSEGRSIAEIAGEEGETGYAFCGLVGPFVTDTSAAYTTITGHPMSCTPITNALYGIIDANGNVIFAKQLDTQDHGGEIATCIRRSNQDSSVFIMCGYSLYPPLQHRPDMHVERTWVARLRRNGNALNLIWAARYQHQIGDSVVNSRAYSLVDMPNGHIYVCGRINEPYDSARGYSGVITAMDTNGIPYWERRYDYGPNEEFRSIIRDSFNLMVIGSMESSTSTASDGIHLNYWAANIDSAGGLIWSRILVMRDPNTGIVKNSGGFDVVRTVNLNGEEMFYISGYAHKDRLCNHVYKVRGDGTAIVHWDDQATKVVETNTFDYNGSGIDIIKNNETTPGIIIFSNIFQDAIYGEDNLKAECNGYHSQVYYNGKSCSTFIYNPESYNPEIDIDTIRVLGNWEGNPTELDNERYDLLDSVYCRQHSVQGGSNSRSSKHKANQNPFIVNLDSYSDSEVRLYIENVNQSQLKFEILSVDGMILQTLAKKVQSNQRISLSISNLPSGIYFVRISDTDQSKVIKLVKAN
ncbi:MAG: T9SS type A sorting domain-containing protein [Saprospiraceae bacterium]|nr:T9SS type A sorting domain-containing protein [Saprospiraceae bacterium]